MVIVPRKHEWASKDRIDPRALTDQPFIFSRQGSGTRKIIEERLMQVGVDLKNTMEFGNTEVVKKAVEAGLGISILSKITILQEERMGTIHSLRLTGVDLRRTFYFAFRKDKYMTGIAEAFLASAVCQNGGQ